MKPFGMVPQNYMCTCKRKNTRDECLAPVIQLPIFKNVNMSKIASALFTEGERQFSDCVVERSVTLQDSENQEISNSCRIVVIDREHIAGCCRPFRIPVTYFVSCTSSLTAIGMNENKPVQVSPPVNKKEWVSRFMISLFVGQNVLTGGT